MQDVEKLIDQIVIIENNKVLLNASVYDICRKLQFVNGEKDVDQEKALYVLPTLLGYNALFPNTKDLETELNLETLFNAVLINSDKINSCLTLKNNPL